MNCKEIKKHFTEYFNGDIDSDKREIISVHIKTCGACKKEYEEYLSLKSEISKIKTPGNDDQFWGNYLKEVEEKIDELPSGKKKEAVKRIEIPFYLRKPVYAAAAVLILAAGLVTYQKYYRTESTMTLNEVAYSNSLEFFIEEFNEVSPGNIFTESFPFDEEGFSIINNHD